MAFICDRLEPSDGSWINRSSTYDDYVDYCRDNGRQPLGKARFIPEMKRKGYIAVKNQGIYKYRGLKFKETPFETIPDYVEPPFR